MLLVSGIILYPVVQLETSESSWSHFWSVFSHIQTDPGIEYVLFFLLSVSLFSHGFPVFISRTLQSILHTVTRVYFTATDSNVSP